MVSRKARLLFVFCSLLPALSAAQPMVVLGGGQKAQECYMNAALAAQNRSIVGRSLLEPCDYTLDYANVSLQDRAATHANRGIVHAAMRNFDAAMADYEEAISMRPSTPEFYVNRGNSFFMLREYASALDDYDLSIELGIRQLHFVHYNMGMVYERLGNDAQAEREYLQALEFDPDWNFPADRLAIVRERMAVDAAARQQQ